MSRKGGPAKSKYEWKKLFRRIRMSEIQRALIDELEDKFVDKNGGTCAVSALKLAQAIGVNERTVRDHLQLFVAAGWIEVEPTPGGTPARISWREPEVVEALPPLKRRGKSARNPGADKGFNPGAHAPGSEEDKSRVQTPGNEPLNPGAGKPQLTDEAGRKDLPTLDDTLPSGTALRAGPERAVSGAEFYDQEDPMNVESYLSPDVEKSEPDVSRAGGPSAPALATYNELVGLRLEVEMVPPEPLSEPIEITLSRIDVPPLRVDVPSQIIIHGHEARDFRKLFAEIWSIRSWTDDEDRARLAYATALQRRNPDDLLHELYWPMRPVPDRLADFLRQDQAVAA